MRGQNVPTSCEDALCDEVAHQQSTVVAVGYVMAKPGHGVDQLLVQLGVDSDLRYETDALEPISHAPISQLRLELIHVALGVITDGAAPFDSTRPLRAGALTNNPG